MNIWSKKWICILIVNGNEKEVYIKKARTVDVNGEQLPAFGEFERGISIIEKTIFEKYDKIKKKYIVSISPKDCDGFKYEDYFFETVKFTVDPTAAGTNAIPKKFFLRQLKKYDKLTFYAYYPTENVKFGTDEKLAEEMKDPGIIYSFNGSDKAKWVETLHIKKELADCPAILDKLENKMYKVDRTEADNKKLFNVPISTKSAFISIGADYCARLNALDDYVNGKCE